MKEAQKRTIKNILQLSSDFLTEQGVESPRLDAEVLLADLLNTERVKLYVNFDYPLNQQELDAYRQRIRERARGKPVSYLTGRREFMSLELIVEEGVLIPRPETEELVEEVLDFCRSQNWKQPKIVDVGTGSGAILVSLLHYLPEARGVGIDISTRALEIARKNLKRFDLKNRAGLLEGDLLKPLLPEKEGQLDLIISNPPYIPESEISRLPRDVRQEPREALAAGDDGLKIYRRLIPQARRLLRQGGLLALEIGHDQSQQVKDTLKQTEGSGYWQDIRLKRDGGGRERIILALKGSENDGD